MRETAKASFEFMALYYNRHVSSDDPRSKASASAKARSVHSRCLGLPRTSMSSGRRGLPPFARLTRRSSSAFAKHLQSKGHTSVSCWSGRPLCRLQPLSCLDAAPGSSYPPRQGNESAGNEPGQDKGKDHDACDRIPVRHEEDSSAYACRVSRERAIKPPSCDPGFVPGREQSAHDHPNH